MLSVVLDKVAIDSFIPIRIYLGKAGVNSIPGLAEVVFLKTQRVPFGTISDDVASRLQVSDLYKSDLQVASRFANDLM